MIEQSTQNIGTIEDKSTGSLDIREGGNVSTNSTKHAMERKVEKPRKPSLGIYLPSDYYSLFFELCDELKGSFEIEDDCDWDCLSDISDDEMPDIAIFHPKARTKATGITIREKIEVNPETLFVFLKYTSDEDRALDELQGCGNLVILSETDLWGCSNKISREYEDLMGIVK
jgi:Mg2+ and Co2+ transporter CorA